MSRVGKQPISVPSGVTITVDTHEVVVKGPKGELRQPQLEGITVVQEGDQMIVGRASEEAMHRAKHGLMRTLVHNMVVGVTDEFEKKLEVNGVGFRVAVSGNQLKMKLGFSHEVVFNVPEGVNVSTDQNIITIKGISKQQVGQVAAEIRSLKKPEPYKGKGIKYVGEHIIRKSGKSGKDK